MRTSIGAMNGDDWEDYCQKLLRIKYPDYQEVPAQFGGDYGIEGFTRSGVLFQCYCPDEEISGIDLYEKQRDKITEDIVKLIKNANSISLLGVNTIREWHFITPKYNHRDILAHCIKKEQQILSSNISVVAKDFRIYIKTEDDYIPERMTYLNSSQNKIHPAENDISTDLFKLQTSNNIIINNIRKKVSKLVDDDTKRDELVLALLIGYVKGKMELDSLRIKYPAVFKSVTELKMAMEDRLAITLSAYNDTENKNILPDTLKDFETALKEDLSGSLTSSLISNLSMEAIADWLGRCPLDIN